MRAPSSRIMYGPQTPVSFRGEFSRNRSVQLQGRSQEGVGGWPSSPDINTKKWQKKNETKIAGFTKNRGQNPRSFRFLVGGTLGPPQVVPFLDEILACMHTNHRTLFRYSRIFGGTIRDTSTIFLRCLRHGGGSGIKLSNHWQV